MTLPLALKLQIPGYRARWHRRYACMLAELAALAPRLSYGEEDGTPWVEIEGGPRFFGFATEPANIEVWRLLRPYLPSSLPRRHFRLVKDLLTRYLFPHMRPDLKPAGFPVEQMFGFHGQHKDAIADLDDAGARSLLADAFRPKVDDVVIDCGAFLGFGELRLSQDVTRGHLVAVEADSDSHALLLRNLGYNGVTNATVLHRAAWNAETELELETDFAQANTLVTEVHEGARKQKVRTIAIDGLVAGLGLDKVDMLSLTLNGAEVETLDGASNTLDSLRPRIRLAGWYTRNGTKIWQLTKAQLEPHGYTVYVGRRGNVMALPSERVAGAS